MKKKYLFAVALGAVAGVVGYKIGSTSSRSPGYTGYTGATESDDVPGYALRPGVPENDPQTILGCDQIYSVDSGRGHDREPGRKVRVLITGANSYIGTSFEKYVSTHYSDEIEIDTIDMKDPSWRDKPFTTVDESTGEQRPYDCVFHVAGIAHADVSTPSREMIENYYRINTDLAIECASRAKECGVKQFVFMSSAIIYGDTSSTGGRNSTGGKIDRTTTPKPLNFYGDSKWQADRGVRALESGDFNVAVLRPPMIYGRGSKGNYPSLSHIAKVTPVFPDVSNRRSMLYIENLCEFVVQVIMGGFGGIFFPQNGEYSSTSDIVRYIAEAHGKRVVITKLLNPVVEIARVMPGRVGGMAQKAFGDSWYEMSMSRYENIDYQRIGLKESIRRTEG